MPTLAINLEPAHAADFEALLALRLRAMRESLERLGRYDEQRARERLAAGFDPAQTQHIVADGRRVGFLVLKTLSHALRLDHLYIDPAWQRRGIGHRLLSDLCHRADREQLPVELVALKGSDANRFYLRHGFVATGEGEWDIDYLRLPLNPSVRAVRGWWAAVQARDWPVARGYLADHFEARWWTSGEYFTGPESFVSVQATYPEGWAIRLIEAEKPVSFPAVPSLWAALMSHPGVTAEVLRPVRVPSSGGAPLPAWVQEKFRALTGRPIYEAYGLSEASGATHCAPFPEGAPLGSIGRPLGAIEARLVDPSDPGGEREVAPGEVGELLVRGEPVMMGYFQNPELTAQVLRGGWLRTGDLAHRDADGSYFIVDRKDDLIITSGYNLYPSEIEAVILRHPAVKDVAVVGVPDRLRGQVARAHVVLNEGAGAAVGADELLALCRDNLSPHKVPRSVVFTDSVPRNPAGKTVRKGLRDPAP